MWKTGLDILIWLLGSVALPIIAVAYQDQIKSLLKIPSSGRRFVAAWRKSIVKTDLLHLIDLLGDDGDIRYNTPADKLKLAYVEALSWRNALHARYALLALTAAECMAFYVVSLSIALGIVLLIKRPPSGTTEYHQWWVVTLVFLTLGAFAFILLMTYIIRAFSCKTQADRCTHVIKKIQARM